ncbi:uncharacterized protein LOC123014468 [Tribolium madens]|uniref:uncharacterized protein LOC123014468 n=1 Tax=Tribolium madens TaxID=41895 RepID=UPI001CF765C5|nr:uncharacterized protein LOC123014468 [Tribolium madens]
MVRKRSRKSESSEDNDSDSDVEFNVEERSQPAPKKYSLRERKKAPSLTADFDYYGLDEEEAETRSSDEDFKMEPDGETASEPDVDPANSEGLIDFEDIIRADIVVNKNKIDYDNLIQKSEIRLTQPKRRGRKPKNSPEEKKEPDDSLVCEPNLETLSHLENSDNAPEEKNGDVTNEILQPEIQFCEGEDALEGEKSETDPLVIKNAHLLEAAVINVPLEGGQNSKSEPVFIKNADLVDTLIAKAFPDEGIHQEDDDVIVLGELKHDVIVLDD